MSITQEELMTTLGLIQKTQKDQVVDSANLPAIIADGMMMRHVVDSALQNCARILEPHRPDRATQWLRDRVVVAEDGETPVLSLIQFELTRGRDDLPSLSANVNIGTQSNARVIPACPIMVHGISFIVMRENRIVSNPDPFLCVILRPKDDKDRFYRALPLGIADKQDIERWNRVVDATAATRSYTRVNPIDTNIMARTPMFFCPTEWEELMETRRNRNRQPYQKPVRAIGSWLGKRVVLDDRSMDPPADIELEDGAATFDTSRPMRFHLIQEREKSLVVRYVGYADEVGKDLVPATEVPNFRIEGLNPFEIFGTTVLRAHPEDTPQRAAAFLNRPLDNRNPVYVAAVKNGLIGEGDTEAQMREAMRVMHGQASDALYDMMQGTLLSTLQWLKKAHNRPSWEEAFQGRTFEEIRGSLNEPEDAVAKWMEKNMTGAFDPLCPLHMTTRREILKLIAETHQPNDESGNETEVKEEQIEGELSEPPNKPKRTRKPKAPKAEANGNGASA